MLLGGADRWDGGQRGDTAWGQTPWLSPDFGPNRSRFETPANDTI